MVQTTELVPSRPELLEADVGPTRGVSWRVSRVNEILKSHGQPSRTLDDKMTHRYYRFRMRYDTMSPAEVAQVERQYPDIWGAVKLYKQAIGAKWLIEAAIMGNVSMDEFPEDVYFNSEILKAYESLFFDIRDKLKYEAYIVSTIFMPRMGSGDPRNFDYFWKVLAYFGKFDFVRDWWRVGEISDTTADWLMTAYRNQVLKDGMIAQQVRVINQYNATEVIGQTMDMVRMINEEQQSRGGTGGIALESLQTLVNSITMSVVSSDKKFSAYEPRLMSLSKDAGLPIAAKHSLPGDE